MVNSTILKHLRSKRTVTIALMLTFIVSISLLLLPIANAHTPKWTIQPYLYIHVAPNPVGIGQQTYIVMFTDWALPGAGYFNDIRFKDFKLTITKPDGHTETKDWPIVPDSGGSVFFFYTPDQLGTYTLKLDYPGQTYTWNQANTAISSAPDFYTYENDTILPATKTVTFTVQQEPVGKVADIPLPTEYWARPIDAQNFLWETISSNWLGGASTSNHWQREGSSPKTPHVMWTRPLELGGLVGGTLAEDATFYEGFSYETRFNNPIIISGILIYELPLSNAGGGGGTVAVDLRTGKEIWYLPNVAISKGQIFSFQQTPNQHGAVAPLLWETAGSTWRAYDALTGKPVFNLTNVPNGVEVYSTGYPFDQNNGMIVRYVFSYNTTSKTGRLLLWNNTLAVLTQEQVFSSLGWRPSGKGNIDASKAYSWNVSITGDITGSQNPTIVGIIPDDIILGRSSDVALASNWHIMSDPWTLWAISDKPESRGQVLWVKRYPAPSGNQTVMFAEQPIDPVNRVFIMTDRETGKHRGYSIDTGELLWGPVGEKREIQYYSAREGFPANGQFIVGGYGGEILVYDTKDGNLLWKFNNTDSGTATPWGLYPTHASAVADGVIYAFPGEHSPNKPLYKGERIRAINATNGAEIWNLMGWSSSGLGTAIAPVAIADGYMAYRNIYDGRIYSVGRGPSETTVSASPQISTFGSSVLITGKVIDTAAGTQQPKQIARFPNGVPAVSDASMSAWMEYVYMQKPRPANAAGVPVTLSVVDANGNYREIGSTISDADGFYSFQWKPDISGKFIVYASFTGSEGYWPSHAVTAFAVDEAAPATPGATPVAPSVADQYFVPAVAGIIAAIVIVGLGVIFALKKRP